MKTCLEKFLIALPRRGLVRIVILEGKTWIDAVDAMNCLEFSKDKRIHESVPVQMLKVDGNFYIERSDVCKNKRLSTELRDFLHSFKPSPANRYA